MRLLRSLSIRSHLPLVASSFADDVGEHRS